MLEKIKTLLMSLPFLQGQKVADPLSHKTSQALRQLNSQYVRQKRLWIYIVLSSIGLVVIYVMFSIFWSTLWEHMVVVPAAWTILAGIGISIFQVRRCNDVIRMLRQAYQVQVQIEKALAEKEALDAAAEKQQSGGAAKVKSAPPPKPSTNGSNHGRDLPDIE